MSASGSAWSSLAAVCGVAVAIHRPDAGFLPQACLTKNEIPVFARPQVAGGEGDVGQSVIRTVWFEQVVQDVGCQDLSVAPLRVPPPGAGMSSSCTCLSTLTGVSKKSCRYSHVRSAIRLAVGEFTDQAEIDSVAVPATSDRSGLAVLVERLAGLPVLVQPLPATWLPKFTRQ